MNLSNDKILNNFQEPKRVSLETVRFYDNENCLYNLE